ncbi:MAG: hypothetical protein CMI60_07905 [Parvibaculum sp.]|nr:hypothetical protein [Parvibaculum sp.]
MATWKKLLHQGDVSEFTPSGSAPNLDYSGMDGGTDLVTENLVYDLVQNELVLAAAGTTNAVEVSGDNGSSVSATDALAHFKYSGAGAISTSISAGGGGTIDGTLTISAETATTATLGVAKFKSAQFAVNAGEVNLQNTVTFNSGNVVLQTNASGNDISIDAHQHIKLKVGDNGHWILNENGSDVAIFQYTSGVDDELQLNIGSTAGSMFRFNSAGDFFTQNDVHVGGNLTVNGTTTQLNTEQLTVDDQKFIINDNAGTLAQFTGGSDPDGGMVLKAGTTGNNDMRFADLVWRDDNQLTGWAARSYDGSFSNNSLGVFGQDATHTAQIMVMDFMESGVISGDSNGIGSIVCKGNSGDREFFIRVQ